MHTFFHIFQKYVDRQNTGKIINSKLNVCLRERHARSTFRLHALYSGPRQCFISEETLTSIAWIRSFRHCSISELKFWTRTENFLSMIPSLYTTFSLPSSLAILFPPKLIPLKIQQCLSVFIQRMIGIDRLSRRDMPPSPLRRRHRTARQGH